MSGFHCSFSLDTYFMLSMRLVSLIRCPFTTVALMLSSRSPEPYSNQIVFERNGSCFLSNLKHCFVRKKL
ncbi:hypothetical protein PMAYCL1PPCAC_20509, partial [Pristionchus mayeri]